ncbi:hypothetical protein E5S67_03975 [Microcoleus sp. IPMA8]|uniref:Putative restriction endonuclease domain-containing protein n=2 Tax=Microcoleus TaxID=44471 RepID=A0ABX2D2J7_9CYAN|nr:Uma2 family endonuclease [Microcoleus asticus]NQE36212.1 hypothetical protein [Microcoleus asticus IPMA8]
MYESILSARVKESVTIQINQRKLTFEEYLSYEDNTDNSYELTDGELIARPPESEPNTAIANYLFLVLVNVGTPWRLIKTHNCEIQVPMLRSGDAANRYLDLVILTAEHIPLTAANSLTFTLNIPAPQLVVKVVSPGRVGNGTTILFEGFANANELSPPPVASRSIGLLTPFSHKR